MSKINDGRFGRILDCFISLSMTGGYLFGICPRVVRYELAECVEDASVQVARIFGVSDYEVPVLYALNNHCMTTTGIAPDENQLWLTGKLHGIGKSVPGIFLANL